jgi:ABC-type branched-subunit amino acid transport system ATPase component
MTISLMPHQNGKKISLERLATVLVQNVNDSVRLADETCVLAEGEIFYLDRLQTNDTDQEGAALLLDHVFCFDHWMIHFQ